MATRVEPYPRRRRPLAGVNDKDIHVGVIRLMSAQTINRVQCNPDIEQSAGRVEVTIQCAAIGIRSELAALP